MRRVFVPFALLALTSTAAAEDTPAVEEASCTSSFHWAQRYRREGLLLAAREQLARCALDDCLDVVRARCVAWREDLATEIPSLVLVSDVDGASWFVDGEPTAGNEAEVDPGKHVVRLEVGAQSESAEVTLERGERGREVRLSLAPPVQPPEAPAPEPRVAPAAAPFQPHPTAWVALGVTGLGLVVGVSTGIAALVQRDGLAEQCELEGCTAEEIDEGRVVGDVSTASFVVAGVGLAGGLTALLVSALVADPAVGVRSGRLEVRW
jgi:hypothetical protein